MTISSMPLMYKSTQNLYGKKYNELLKRFHKTEKLRHPGKRKVQKEEHSPAVKHALNNTKDSEDSRKALHIEFKTALHTGYSILEQSDNGGVTAEVPESSQSNEKTKTSTERNISQHTREYSNVDVGNTETPDLFGGKQTPNTRRSPFIQRNKNKAFNRTFTSEDQRSRSEPAFLPPINGLPPLSKAAKQSLRQVQSVSPPVHLVADVYNKPVSRMESLKELMISTESLNTNDSNPSRQNSVKGNKSRMGKLKINSGKLKSSKQLTRRLNLKSNGVDFQNRPKVRSQTEKYLGRIGGNGKPPIDEPGIMRKKIPEFKKWHFHYYKEQLEDLPSLNQVQRPVDNRETEPVVVNQNNHIVGQQETNIRVTVDVGKHDQINATTGSTSHIHREIRPSETTEVYVNDICRDNTNLDTNPINRITSAKTWRTWRSKNDSFAYNDVTKYIEENQLMSLEKRHLIEQWITDVDNSSNTLSQIFMENSITDSTT